MADVYTEISFGGLLVKISSEVGGEFGGKMFLIPEKSLKDFAYAPTDIARQSAFDEEMHRKKPPLINVDYAIFLEDFKIRGSAGG